MPDAEKWRPARRALSALAAPLANYRTTGTGTSRAPDYLGRTGRRAATDLKLPDVNSHALRNSHPSALILAGVDVLTISRRLGHATPAFTLTAYGHLVTNTDAGATQAIDMGFGAKPQ